MTQEERDKLVMAIGVILAGSWNKEGVILWWDRPRHQLDGLTPGQAFDQGQELDVLLLAISGLSQTAT